MKLRDWILEDRRDFYARSIDREHGDQIEQLAEQNRRLVDALETHRQVLKALILALERKGIIVEGDDELRAVAEIAPRAAGNAKFACSRCGVLMPESELARVDGEFVCGLCNVEPPPEEGRYR